MLGLLLTLLAAACSRAGEAGGPAPAGVVRFDLAADPTTLNPLFAHPDAASVERRRLVQWTLAFMGLSAAWHLAEGTPADLDLAVAGLAADSIDSP